MKSGEESFVRCNAMNSIEAKLIKSMASEETEKLKTELKTSIDKMSLQYSVDKEELLKKLQESYTQITTQSDTNLKNQIFEKISILTTGIGALNSQIAKVSEELGANVSQNSEKTSIELANFKNKLDILEQNIETFLKQSLLEEVKNNLTNYFVIREQ